MIRFSATLEFPGVISMLFAFSFELCPLAKVVSVVFLEILFIFHKCAVSTQLSYLHQTLPVQGKIASKIVSRDIEQPEYEFVVLLLAVLTETCCGFSRGIIYFSLP